MSSACRAARRSCAPRTSKTRAACSSMTRCPTIEVWIAHKCVALPMGFPSRGSSVVADAVEWQSRCATKVAVPLGMIWIIFRMPLSEEPAGATDGYVVVDPGDVLVEEDLGGE